MHPDSKTLLSSLTNEGLIRVSGADAVAFLQGQLSTDLEKLTPELGQFSSWSNAKGRVVVLFHVFRWNKDIFLSLPTGLLPTVLKKLGMYVLRSRVKLMDFGKDIARIGIAGGDAPRFLVEAGIKVPTDVNEATHNQNHILAMRLHGALPRYALYGPGEGIASLMQKLEAAGAGRGDEETWAMQKVLASEPTVYPETSEYFVAQMLDLDKLGAIDFKKGCYIGQEVIARAHYRGGVKRHLTRAESHSTMSLKPGTQIHAAGRDSQVAEVVDARLDPESIWQMLIVIQDDARQMKLHTADDVTVKLVS